MDAAVLFSQQPHAVPAVLLIALVAIGLFATAAWFRQRP
jgi:hypothetical protein